MEISSNFDEFVQQKSQKWLFTSEIRQNLIKFSSKLPNESATQLAGVGSDDSAANVFAKYLGGTLIR